MVANDSQSSNNISYSSAWVNALKYNPISFVLWVCNVPAIGFLASLVSYHTYLSCYNMTTNEHLKQYFKDVTFSPYTSGSILKNLFLRIFERTPKSLLRMDLRIKDKISVNETKAELERRFDIKKTVLDQADEEQIKKNNEMLAKRHNFFK